MDVSRETVGELQKFEALLKKWNSSINLVSKRAINELWPRHIEDSIRIYKTAGSQTVGHWIDMGAGGGFPGLVCAILDQKPNRFRFTLIESDQRKSVFLRQVVRELDLNTDVLTARIEEASCPPADVISARALADLGSLIGLSARFHHPRGTKLLFPKGTTWQKEVNAAKKEWDFKITEIFENDQVGSVILHIPSESCQRRVS